MPDPNLTSIALVVDRSGSMATCKDEAQGGLNAFVKDQAARPGRCRLTLVDFDAEYRVLHDDAPIGDVPEYTLEPRGMTAMLDAVGRAIDALGASLAARPEPDRPGKVVFVIVTDGQENASREYSAEKVAGMIAHQREEYGWEFVFLGANIDAAKAAKQINIPASNAANYATGNSGLAFAMTSSKIGLCRAGAGLGLAWTDGEREGLIADVARAAERK